MLWAEPDPTSHCPGGVQVGDVGFVASCATSSNWGLADCSRNLGEVARQSKSHPPHGAAVGGRLVAFGSDWRALAKRGPRFCCDGNGTGAPPHQGARGRQERDVRGILQFTAPCTWGTGRADGTSRRTLLLPYRLGRPGRNERMGQCAVLDQRHRDPSIQNAPTNQQRLQETAESYCMGFHHTSIIL